jgi:hypothetical protein
VLVVVVKSQMFLGYRGASWVIGVAFSAILPCGLLGAGVLSCWHTFCSSVVTPVMSHPIMCDNRLGNMYNLRENMANSTGE